MARTTFSGPLLTGTLKDDPGANLGSVILSQSVALGFDATLVQSATIIIPESCRIINIFVDVITAYDSATSATLSVGTVAAGTQYASGVNAKTTARTTPTFTTTQLTNFRDTTTNTNVVATVTSVGQPTTGATFVTISYVQL